MDPKALKAAAEQLRLTEAEKQAMIDACAGRKRQPLVRRIAAIAAALLILTALVAAPGFLLRAGRAKDAAPAEDYALMVDQKDKLSDENYTEAVSAASAVRPDGEDPTRAYGGDPDASGGSILTQKYRDRYYNITAPFVELVGRDICLAWYDSLGENYDPGEENVMLMKSFIQHFNISRQDFDRCVIEDAKWISEAYPPCMNPKDYAAQELDELYNGDIIYTFDDEIINNYYRSEQYAYYDMKEYEESVAGGAPTYTTDFFTVEELEAAYIEKYGSLD